MVGCEIADYLSEKGKKTTILEMLPEISMSKGITMMTRLLNRLATKGVRILTDSKCREITEMGVVFLNEEGQKRTIAADTVMLAAGSKPNRELCQTIGRQVPETYLVGDCVRPRRIMEAVAEGFQVARRL
jgi:pyruvate/2-oxoglutarate dehydrogenase complex dihydrolipoamide dehydrogenase (E3) component